MKCSYIFFVKGSQKTQGYNGNDGKLTMFKTILRKIAERLQKCCTNVIENVLEKWNGEEEEEKNSLKVESHRW